jgi:broad specificity phosphatase PhoE
MIRAYLIRHGDTGSHGVPEGWKQVPITSQGKEDARSAAAHLQAAINAGWPEPDYIATSDLLRAEQTSEVIAETLNLDIDPPMFDLRAYEKRSETPEDYEARSRVAFEKLLSDQRLPVIAAHRSTTAFLDKSAVVGARHS